MSAPIEGVVPALIMPFEDAGGVDAGDLRRQVEFVVESGCQGVLVGQVSEYLRLAPSERIEVAGVCADATPEGACCVMSSGAESSEAAIELSLRAEAAGVDALLVMHPATYALDDGEMLEYFARIIEAVSVPVLVHHVGSLARQPLGVGVQAQLLEQFGADRVLFKPEAPPASTSISELRERTGGAARILAGDGGAMLIDTHRRGLAGVVPATETAEIVGALWRLLEAGEEERARTLGHAVSYLMCHMMMSIDRYAAIAKHLLHRRGLIRNVAVRRPGGAAVDEETLVEVARAYDELLVTAKEMTQ